MNKRWSGLVTVSVIAILITACGGGNLGDANHNLAGLLPVTLDDWVRTDSISSFDRETIFRYINGAGEVYNSYAFSQVAVVHYSRGEDSEILVELFDMGNDADAYGAFSYAREDEQSGLGGGYEQRGSVLCFWQNKYYCCVAIEGSGEQSAGDLQSMARAVSGKLPDTSERPKLVSALPDDGLIRHSDRFFHLKAALNYNYYLARDNILKLSSTTDCVLARYQPGSTYLLLVEYPSADEATTALKSFRESYLQDTGNAEVVSVEDGKFVGSRQAGRTLTVVLDAAASDVAAQLLDDATPGLDALGDRGG